MATTELTTSMSSRVAKDVAATPSRRVGPAERTGAAPEAAAAAAAAEAAEAAKQASAEEAEAQALAREDVQGSVDKLNEMMQSVRRELQFSIDDDSGRTIIKVIDAETQEIVRQIPPEEVMTLVERLSGGNVSLLGGVIA